jgi:quinohemoprotein amine dehydrogenase
VTLIPLFLALPLLALGRQEGAIPVTDPLVLSKCASCHPVDEHGNMQRLSWERATPEGWEEVLKRMLRTDLVALTPTEAREVIKYLSASHGLAPEETKPVMYYVERRINAETGLANDNLLDACGKCHAVARALSWRRSLADWKLFVDEHSERYKLKPNAEVIAFLCQAAPLRTPEWAAWSARKHWPEISGRWLVTAHVAGRGTLYGEMNVQPGKAEGEFTTRVTLRSVNDGSAIVRAGHVVVYGGHEWRGRSKGAESPGSIANDMANDMPNDMPDDLANEAREALWISPDGSKAQGRWFWGQYQEFGFDVTMQRASTRPVLLATDVPSMKIGSEANHIRLIGENFPARVKPADLSLGPGVSVRRIASSTASEIVAEVDVATDAVCGKRDVAFQSVTLPGALAIYDRVDYVKVTPDSAMAAFGGGSSTRGFQQFEAIGYQRGADGRLHTADDMELGPVDVTWSMEVFYEVDGSKRDLVGRVSSTGFFTPAAESAGANYDVWVIATARNEKNKEGKPLVGKSYLVVTVPSYTFNGRKYVRDLDRWIEEGSGTR